MANDPRLLLLSPNDNVMVLRAPINANETIEVTGQTVTIPARLGLGHKIACHAVRPGEKVLKYGVPIGSASVPIAVGDHVHLHNLKSDYTPTYALTEDGEVA